MVIWKANEMLITQKIFFQPAIIVSKLLVFLFIFSDISKETGSRKSETILWDTLQHLRRCKLNPVKFI